MVCVLFGELAVSTASGAQGVTAAQGTATIQGQVVNVDSTTPVPGVVVALIDSTGRERARALTGVDGRFSLTVAAPARYSLRALKIGLRPTVLPLIDVADGETSTERVVLGTESVRLDAVRVEGETSCRISQDSAQTVARLWEQAKGVLAASTMAAGGKFYETTLLRYRNYVPFDERRVVSETGSIVETAGANGFVSLSEDSLALEGYIVTAGPRREFRAPDAAVLLSPSFAGGHCFRVVPPPRDRPDQVGIAFQPSSARRGISDIDGTFWLDRESAELRRLEFKYVNLPPRMRRDDAEGWVEFARLPTGDWIVSRWAIRTPVNDHEAQVMRNMPARVIGMTTAGGMTRSIAQDDSVIYLNSAASLTVRLTDSDSLNGVVGSAVNILGTQRLGYTDSTHSVTFENLPLGKYRLQAWTPLMLWINADPVERDVDVNNDTGTDFEIKMPTAAATNTCVKGWTFVYGAVTRSDGSPAKFAAIRIDHISSRAAVSSAAEMYRKFPAAAIVYSDQYGRWKTCQLPRPTSFALAMGAFVGQRHSMSLMSGGGFLRLDFSENELIRP
ncbi:MAG: carboxypeptidase regulatory-like domain-containing protein [Gemmatimonadetes bacterium]|nr:carboxypeptidase regulatory-like domain-containing protein [Gemmatimonadota bacterium]